MGGGGTKGGGAKDGKGGGGGGARAKAARKYLDQADTLQLQIHAVRDALYGPKGKPGEFRQALKRRLKNTLRGMTDQDNILIEAFNQRVKDLQASATDNEKAQAGQSFENLSNAARERANAVTQAALQGAGESDLLQAQQMSLRNWAQNQGDIDQAAFDTSRSISASLTDLTADTKTARSNVALQANADRESLWSDYFDQREQALIQIGNLQGQKAELYGYANEAKSSKKTRRKLKRAQKHSGESFSDAADMAGKAWRNPGVPKRLETWTGPGIDPMAPHSDASILYGGGGISAAPSAPSGASLRKW
jgi:hypothetical protein